MRRYRTPCVGPWRLGAAGLALLLGCGPGESWVGFGSRAVVSRPTPLHVVDTGSVVIRLARTACFGTCPVYWVEISGHGEVTYEGHQHVAYAGRERATITRQDVATLLRRFERLDYFSLPPLDAESCSDVTDYPSAFTSIAVDGRSRSVDHYNGCGRAPAALSVLEAAIDSVAGTDRWIELPTRPPGAVSGPPPTETVRGLLQMTVAVHSWWRLVDARTGRSVSQRRVAAPGVGGGQPLPAIAIDSFYRRVPLLSAEEATVGAIRGAQHGYGVLVEARGTLVTSGDLVHGWRREYDPPADGDTALVTDSTGRVVLDEGGAAQTESARTGWRPVEGGHGVPSVSGVLDSVRVELADGTRLRARVLAFSRDTAIAWLAVEAPRPLPSAEFRGELLTPGDDAYALPADWSPSGSPAAAMSEGILVRGSIRERRSAGEAKDLDITPAGLARHRAPSDLIELERYRWSPQDEASDELQGLGTPLFDERGRLVGLRVAPLVAGDYPGGFGARSNPIAAVRRIPPEASGARRSP